MGFNNKGIRCTHEDRQPNEKATCFAFRGGSCDVLQSSCKDRYGHCKFFKSKETYLQELKVCAERQDINFEVYLDIIGLSSLLRN